MDLVSEKNLNTKEIKMMSKILEVKPCELHNIPSYYLDDGTVKHTCVTCHPELEPKKERHFRITNYGAHDAAAGGYCDNETLEMLRKDCVISIQCPPKAENNLYEDHLDLTGYEHDEKYVYKVKDSQKYWYSSKIEFTWKKGMMFNTLFNVKNCRNKKSISSNALVGFLLANGFKLGKNS